MDASPRAVKQEKGFSLLPPEIIAEIAAGLVFARSPEYRFWEETCQQLKILRLAHREFADCGYINKILFARIRLEPTRGGLTTIQLGDFSRVSNYVDSITFITPPSWELSFETYESIVNDADRISAFFSQEKLAEGYAAYMRDAKDAQALLQDLDGELKKAWTRILKRSGNRLKTVRLLSDECKETRHIGYYDTPSQIHSGVPCRLPRHDHGMGAIRYGCHYATAVAGDRLFSMAMSCLSASRVAILNLTIETLMTANVECTKIPGWQQLDFSLLRKLEFSCEFPSDEHGLVSEAVKAVTAENMEKTGNIAHQLIDKCHSSIAEITLGGFNGDATVWPTRAPTYELPELHTFTQRVDHNPLLLQDWLLHMPSLGRFTLGGKIANEYPSVDLRYVFDAIRDHPNVSGPNPKGLEVVFEQIVASGWVEISYDGTICKDSSIATARCEPDTSSDHLIDCGYPLEAHFYGETKFKHNYPLRYQLDDWDPENEDSDEDESEEWEEESSEEE
ncbi:hypothetical protein NW768_007488 [Fusarium equiseti]|uniref:F-box domain-containing protein n=1 Tax=Fusarium equiseti TaxID=61235 RepID=A0ABQ8R800_FUSEQ|nr:hypothetical protein NW768_007488 [Fusarium equiseti]